MTKVLSHPIPGQIQVSGSTLFERKRWKEAILYYLFGIWADKEEVTYRPKINFGDITLCLNKSEGTYSAVYNCQAGEEHNQRKVVGWPQPFTIYPGQILAVDNNQIAVEQGLARFVKNNSIKMLIINLSNISAFYIWKDPDYRFRVAGLSINCRCTVPFSD